MTRYLIFYVVKRSTVKNTETEACFKRYLSRVSLSYFCLKSYDMLSRARSPDPIDNRQIMRLNVVSFH